MTSPNTTDDQITTLTNHLSSALYRGIIGDYEYLMRNLADVITAGGVPRAYEDIVRVGDLGYRRDSLIGHGHDEYSPTLQANSEELGEACAILAEQLVQAIPTYLAQGRAS